MIFNPSRDEVRRFFRDTRAKRHAGTPLTPLSPLETIVGDWMERHPEYDPVLAPVAQGEEDPFEPRDGEPNPFLHLSMHVSIDEQVSIDQPAGIRAAIQRLAERTGSLHDAHHEAMECLGEMLWTAQRNGTAPDGEAYIRCIGRRASRIA